MSQVSQLLSLTGDTRKIFVTLGPTNLGHNKFGYHNFGYHNFSHKYRKFLVYNNFSHIFLTFRDHFPFHSFDISIFSWLFFRLNFIVRPYTRVLVLGRIFSIWEHSNGEPSIHTLVISYISLQ